MTTTSMIRPKINKILDPVGDAVDRGTRDPEEIKWVFDCHKRHRAALDLAKLGEEAVNDMIDYAGISNLDRRICVLMALGRIGSKKATPFLIEKLPSEYWIERHYAAGALELIADPMALDALKKGLEEEDVVRGPFFGAIIAVADDSTRDLFLKALEEENSHIRRAVMRCFAETPGSDVLEILLGALHDKQMGVVFDAVRGLRLYGDRIVDELIEKLTAKGRYTRKAAVELLGDSKSARAVAPLCEQLATSKNKALREDIAFALGTLKDPGAAPALRKALSDPASGVIENAAVALGKIGLPETVPDLEKLLRSRGSGVSGVAQNNAAEAIGKIKAPIAVKALRKALRHDDREIRVTAMHGLRKQKAIEAIPAIRKALETEKNDEVRKAYEKSLYKLTQTKAAKNRGKTNSKRRAVPADPAAQLAAAEPSIRKKGIAAMKKSGDPGNIARLEPLLFDEDIQVRKSASLAIKKLGAGEVIPELMRRLKTEDGTRVPHVIEALGWMGDRENMEALAPFLRSEAAHVRRSAKTALKRLKIDKALLQEMELEVKVEDALKKRTSSPIVKLGAPAIPILRRIMADLTHPHLMVAVFSLYKLDWRPRTLEEKICYFTRLGRQKELNAIASEGFPLLKELYIKGDEPEYVAKALASVGAEGVAILLEENTRHFGSLSENPVVDALVEHGKDHIDLIIEYFQRDDATLEEKGYLSLALGAMGAKEAVKPLMDFLEAELDRLSSEDEDACFAAARALGKIGDKRATPLLCDALRSNQPWEGAAAWALGDIGDKEAVFVLLDARKQGDSNLRSLAAEALKKIGHEARGDREKGLAALAGGDYGALSLYAGHVIPEIIEEVDHEYPNSSLVKILGSLEGDDVMGALAKVLDSQASNPRKEAHAALIRYGQKAYPFLIQAVQRRGGNNRREASILLGRLKNPAAVEHLLPVLKEKYPGTVKAAVDALGKSKSEKAVRPLLELLPHDNVPLVRAVLTALGKIKAPEAAAPLKKLALSDPKLEKLRVDVIAKIEKARGKKR
ncbi:MAG: hypothetical protein GY859_44035 [Desulfobacterales bacterium]|nr:hypothetical protein [Desulfobacterales bacterium]